MLTVLLTLVCVPFWFGPAADSPVYAERAAARRLHRRAYPLSVVWAQHVGRQTASLDLQDAADLVLDRWADDPARWDCVVWALAADQSLCRDGRSLPWLISQHYLRYKHSEPARKAMCRLLYRMRAAGLRPQQPYMRAVVLSQTETSVTWTTTVVQADVPWPCEVCTADWLRHSYEGALGGINDLRFVLRGLPVPSLAGSPRLGELKNFRRTIHGELFIPPFLVERMWAVRMPAVLPAPPGPPES